MRISRIKDVKLPNRGTEKSAGLDFFVPNDFETVILHPSDSTKIASGIKVEVPKGYALIIFNKSGVALKGLQVGACVIDEDYQGEINLHVYNYSHHPIRIEPGQKLVQMILIPVLYADIEEVYSDELFTEATSRGEGGFGSTGTH